MAGPLRPIWRTLRFRLTIWNIIVVLITSLATVLGLREGVRYALMRELDQVLLADLQEIALAFESAASSELNEVQENLQRKAEGHKHQDWFVQLLGENRDVVWESGSRLDRAAEGESEIKIRSYEQSVAPLDGVRAVRVGASLQFIKADMRRIDGLAVVVTLIAVVAAPIGGYFLAIGAIRPLTEFTRVASTLAPIKLGQRLPVQNTGDELDVLSQTINKLLDRIDKHLQRRRDSLANSAHELRSPLAAIRSSVEVALNDQRSAAEYEELLLDVIEQCEGLESLVNQLLLLAETEDASARESFEVVPWSDLVLNSVDVFRAAAEVADVELAEHIEPGILVRGNRQHLRQVINNLLDNSIKYTPRGGSVSVYLNASEANEAVLRVMDTGVGIPAEDLPRVCERFFRGDKAHRRQYGTRGTGLGLSICQSVVEAHGGTIKVDSHLGDGTTVTVRLPLGTSDEE